MLCSIWGWHCGLASRQRGFALVVQFRIGFSISATRFRYSVPRFRVYAWCCQGVTRYVSTGHRVADP
eukprot:3541057-Rhodomonas_salina.1